MKHIHGGDIYADNWNEEPLDFSANINPLGMPDSVRAKALLPCAAPPIMSIVMLVSFLTAEQCRR